MYPSSTGFFPLYLAHFGCHVRSYLNILFIWLCQMHLVLTWFYAWFLYELLIHCHCVGIFLQVCVVEVVNLFEFNTACINIFVVNVFVTIFYKVLLFWTTLLLSPSCHLDLCFLFSTKQSLAKFFERFLHTSIKFSQRKFFFKCTNREFGCMLCNQFHFNA